MMLADAIGRQLPITVVRYSEMFTLLGMNASAERARVELQTTGEHARKRSVDTLGQLTPRETRSPASSPRETPTERSPLNCSSA
jgi:hypothetical protein